MFFTSVALYFPSKIDSIGSPLYGFYLRWFAPTHRTKSANTLCNIPQTKERENTSAFSMDSQRSSTSLQAMPPSVTSASTSSARSALNSGLEVDCARVGMRSVFTKQSAPSTGDIHPSIRKRTLTLKR